MPPPSLWVEGFSRSGKKQFAGKMDYPSADTTVPDLLEQANRIARLERGSRHPPYKVLKVVSPEVPAFSEELTKDDKVLPFIQKHHYANKVEVRYAESRSRSAGRRCDHASSTHSSSSSSSSSYSTSKEKNTQARRTCQRSRSRKSCNRRERSRSQRSCKRRRSPEKSRATSSRKSSRETRRTPSHTSFRQSRHKPSQSRELSSQKQRRSRSLPRKRSNSMQRRRSAEKEELSSQKQRRSRSLPRKRSNSMQRRRSAEEEELNSQKQRRSRSLPRRRSISMQRRRSPVRKDDYRRKEEAYREDFTDQRRRSSRSPFRKGDYRRTEEAHREYFADQRSPVRKDDYRRKEEAYREDFTDQRRPCAPSVPLCASPLRPTRTGPRSMLPAHPEPPPHSVKRSASSSTDKFISGGHDLQPVHALSVRHPPLACGTYQAHMSPSQSPRRCNTQIMQSHDRCRSAPSRPVPQPGPQVPVREDFPVLWLNVGNREILCVKVEHYTQRERFEGLLSQSHHLMECATNETVSFDDDRSEAGVETAISSAPSFQHLNPPVFWQIAYAGDLTAIGVAGNKKARTRAAKLAVALVAAIENGTGHFRSPPPQEFMDLVDEASRHRGFVAERRRAGQPPGIPRHPPSTVMARGGAREVVVKQEDTRPVGTPRHPSGTVMMRGSASEPRGNEVVVKQEDTRPPGCANPMCTFAIHTNPSVSTTHCCKMCEESDRDRPNVPPKHGKKCEAKPGGEKLRSPHHQQAKATQPSISSQARSSSSTGWSGHGNSLNTQGLHHQQPSGRRCDVPAAARSADQASQSRQAKSVLAAKQSQGSLCAKWREVANGKGKDRITPLPSQFMHASFAAHLSSWLEDRNLHTKLTQEMGRCPENCIQYRVIHPAVVGDANKFTSVAYHGTWFYALWSILNSGVLLESNDLDAGHEFWKPGVFCSPLLETARWYARPSVVFGDGVYHRVVLELKVDTSSRIQKRDKGGFQWIFPSDAVFVHKVLFFQNDPPDEKGRERVSKWDPALEALPAGKQMPPVICDETVTLNDKLFLDGHNMFFVDWSSRGAERFFAEKCSYAQVGNGPMSGEVADRESHRSAAMTNELDNCEEGP